jgi:hypothetical protein
LPGRKFAAAADDDNNNNNNNNNNKCSETKKIMLRMSENILVIRYCHVFSD